MLSGKKKVKKKVLKKFDGLGFWVESKNSQKLAENIYDEWKSIDKWLVFGELLNNWAYEFVAQSSYILKRYDCDYIRGKKTIKFRVGRVVFLCALQPLFEQIATNKETTLQELQKKIQKTNCTDQERKLLQTQHDKISKYCAHYTVKTRYWFREFIKFCKTTEPLVTIETTLTDEQDNVEKLTTLYRIAVPITFIFRREYLHCSFRAERSKDNGKTWGLR